MAMTTVPVTNGTKTNAGPASMLLFNQQAAERKLCAPLRTPRPARNVHVDEL